MEKMTWDEALSLPLVSDPSPQEIACGLYYLESDGRLVIEVDSNGTRWVSAENLAGINGLGIDLANYALGPWRMRRCRRTCERCKRTTGDPPPKPRIRRAEGLYWYSFPGFVPHKIYPDIAVNSKLLIQDNTGLICEGYWIPDEGAFSINPPYFSGGDQILTPPENEIVFWAEYPRGVIKCQK